VKHIPQAVVVPSSYLKPWKNMFIVSAPARRFLKNWCQFYKNQRSVKTGCNNLFGKRKVLG